MYWLQSNRLSGKMRAHQLAAFVRNHVSRNEKLLRCGNGIGRTFNRLIIKAICCHYRCWKYSFPLWPGSSACGDDLFTNCFLYNCDVSGDNAAYKITNAVECVWIHRSLLMPNATIHPGHFERQTELLDPKLHCFDERMEVFLNVIHESIRRKKVCAFWETECYKRNT